MKNTLIIACAAFLQTACISDAVWASSDIRLPAGMAAENQASSRYSLTINNESKAVEVSRAVAMARDKDTLISMRVTRRNFQSLPHSVHIDLLIYGHDNQLIETKTKSLRSHQFRHRPNGSFLPANINVSIGSHRDDIAKVEIITHSENHSNHSTTFISNEEN